MSLCHLELRQPPSDSEAMGLSTKGQRANGLREGRLERARVLEDTASAAPKVTPSTCKHWNMTTWPCGSSGLHSVLIRGAGTGTGSDSGQRGLRD